MLEGGGKLLAGAVGDKRMLSASRYSFAKAVTAPMKHAFYVAHLRHGIAHVSKCCKV